MSIEDYDTIKKHSMKNNYYPKEYNSENESFIYGIKILKTEDLKSGEFKLSINLE